MNRTINFLVRAATNTAFRSVQVRRVAPEPPGRRWSWPTTVAGSATSSR